MLKEALELHSHLNPAIWDKDWNLLPEVEDRIYKIVNKFQSECMLPLDIGSVKGARHNNLCSDHT